MSAAEKRLRESDSYLSGPAYCANCGADLFTPSSLVVEYWRNADSIRSYWCHQCHGSGDVVAVQRVTAWEPEE